MQVAVTGALGRLGAALVSGLSGERHTVRPSDLQAADGDPPTVKADVLCLARLWASLSDAPLFLTLVMKVWRRLWKSRYLPVSSL